MFGQDQIINANIFFSWNLLFVAFQTSRLQNTKRAQEVCGLTVSVSAIFEERYGSRITAIYQLSVKRKRFRCGSNFALFLLLIVFKEQGSGSVLKRSRAFPFCVYLCVYVHACIVFWGGWRCSSATVIRKCDKKTPAIFNLCVLFSHVKNV